MKILFINNSNNQITHKAVNQKFLKQARDNFMRYAPNHNQLPIITDIMTSVIYGLISVQDGIDTFEAIKPYSKNVIGAIEDDIKALKKSISNP